MQSLAAPFELTVSGRKAFHRLPRACGSVLLTQLSDIIHTKNVVQSAGDSGQGTSYRLSSPGISADLLLLGHRVLKCLQFALK